MALPRVPLPVAPARWAKLVEVLLDTPELLMRLLMPAFSAALLNICAVSSEPISLALRYLPSAHCLTSLLMPELLVTSLTWMRSITLPPRIVTRSTVLAVVLLVSSVRAPLNRLRTLRLS